MNNNKYNHYLKSVKLSGYKSIIGIEIDFEDGLNIIIGKNAAGKTNFLTFLYEVFDFSFKNLLNFTSELMLSGGREILIESNSKNVNDENNKFIKPEVVTRVTIDNKIIEIGNRPKDDLDFLTGKNNISFISTFIKHGIPLNYYLVDSSFSYKIGKKEFHIDIISKILAPETPYFIKSILAKLVFIDIEPFVNELNTDSIKKSIIEAFNQIEKIKKALMKFSPIEDIRFNKNINIFFDEDTEEYTVNNLFIEFQIQGTWHPFENLSDGTKRLFYIISEIGLPGNLHITNTGFGFNDDESKRIILIEEPELGIHPHQLINLMQYLKVESKNKQIIVTSHSPDVLDTLNENELNRIIIAYSENRTIGTKLRHLSNDEKSKALMYIKDDFLSDYWKYSDLEE